MQIDFKNRVAIITGSGGGLGRTYAIELARRGAAVVVNDLGGAFDGKGSSNSMADAVVNEIRAAGGTGVANYDSVGTRAGGESIVETAMKSFGRVDIVINNAGHLRNAPFEAVTYDILDSIIQVHLKGAFYVTQPAYKIMQKQRYGRIVFASSAAGMLGNTTQSAYGAAKAGLVGLMHVLALEGAEYGVLCNALLPTATSRMEKAMPAEQMEKFASQFAAIAKHAGNSLDPHFVTPMVVYLASEACKSTHAIYSATWGRYARAFVALSEGWLGPRDKPASVEDIAQHFGDIQSKSGLVFPQHLMDEFAELTKAIERSAAR
ncbi:MAG: SDR family NAD(P)-dependent oxidoreductase [Sinobacteraceae bacterium]|nr:SDR family NAD(P)-dependent oxidoreductase [Nevskiaceae bacterium]